MSVLAGGDATTVLSTIFGRLFENEFASLEGITISLRRGGDVYYVDETTALDCLLAGDQAMTMSTPAASFAQVLHVSLFDAVPDARCVISGWSRHLRALQQEGMALPSPTSMMRKRGITDLAQHLVEADALVGPQLEATVDGAMALAARNAMGHLLLVTTDGLVVVAGSPPHEVMAHWHNVEFAARIACMSLEEEHAAGGQRPR